MAEMLLFALSEHQASFHEKNHQSHDGVFLAGQNTYVRCHSNEMVDKKWSVVEDATFEGDDFRCLENIMAQGNGKNQAECAIVFKERILEDVRICQQNDPTHWQCWYENEVGGAEKKETEKPVRREIERSVTTT